MNVSRITHSQAEGQPLLGVKSKHFRICKLNVSVLWDYSTLPLEDNSFSQHWNKSLFLTNGNGCVPIKLYLQNTIYLFLFQGHRKDSKLFPTIRRLTISDDLSTTSNLLSVNSSSNWASWHIEYFSDTHWVYITLIKLNFFRDYHFSCNSPVVCFSLCVKK